MPLNVRPDFSFYKFQMCSRNMKKCEDKTQSMEDEFKENQETLVKLDAELKQLEEDATKVLEAYNSAQVSGR